MVYGLLTTGCYEQAIVINPYEKCFLLMDYLNKDTRQLTPRYQCINSCQNGWIICEKVFLLRLMRGEHVPVADAAIPIVTNEDADGAVRRLSRFHAGPADL